MRAPITRINIKKNIHAKIEYRKNISMIQRLHLANILSSNCGMHVFVFQIWVCENLVLCAGQIPLPRDAKATQASGKIIQKMIKALVCNKLDSYLRLISKRASFDQLTSEFNTLNHATRKSPFFGKQHYTRWSQLYAMKQTFNLAYDCPSTAVTLFIFVLIGAVHVCMFVLLVFVSCVATTKPCTSTTQCSRFMS